MNINTSRIASLRRNTVRTMYLLILALLLGSCAGVNHYSLARKAMDSGEWRTALDQLDKARAKDPENPDISIATHRARGALAGEEAREGTAAEKAGDYSGAEQHFRAALEYDLANAAARDGLRRLTAMRDAETLYQEGLYSEQSGQTADARRLYRSALDTYPGHAGAAKHLETLRESGDAEQNSELARQVTFSFNDIALQEIFHALSAVSGINILMDDSPVFQKHVSLELENVSIDNALHNLGRTYGLLVVPLNRNTFLITLDTPDNRTRNSREEVRIFRLKYADATELRKMISPVLKSAVILADERINAIVVRADSSHMDLVSELISSLDIRESEVLIEMEVMEISRDNVKKLGTGFGSDPRAGLTIGGTVKSTGESGRLTVSDLNGLGGSQLFVTLPSVYLDLLKQDSQTRILAQPRLQILNRTPAKLHIGEKVPVKVTTSLFRDTAEETSVYEYRDVGILMNLTPRILSPSELALDLHLEISSIVSEGESGHPTIGTRDVMTTLRLRNGETEIIAGLIKDEERKGAAKIPLVGEIPVMGKLFSSESGRRVQTDIVVSLTPHILDRRVYPRSETPLWTGPGESNGGTRAARTAATTAPEHRAAGIIPPPPENEPAEETPKPDDGSSRDTGTTSPETTARVTFDPIPITVKKGGTGIVHVRISDAVNVGSVPFYIEFDPQIISVDRVSEGDFLAGDGRSTAFMNSVDNERGRVIVGATRLGGGEGVSGDGTLLEMEITGKQTGETPLRFTHQSVRDPMAAVLPAIFTDGRAVVAD